MPMVHTALQNRNSQISAVNIVSLPSVGSNLRLNFMVNDAAGVATTPYRDRVLGTSALLVTRIATPNRTT